MKKNSLCKWVFGGTDISTFFYLESFLVTCCESLSNFNVQNLVQFVIVGVVLMSVMHQSNKTALLHDEDGIVAVDLIRC